MSLERLQLESISVNAPPLRLKFCEPYEVREGGMAYVYLCKGSGPFKSRIAVKRLKPEYGASDEVARLFLRECYIWMQLGSHPNVVRAYSAHGMPPEPAMVVLEFVPQCLRDQLKGKPIPIQRAMCIAADICAGMLHVAKRMPGFVHRDLKPENILLTKDTTAKVTDFGLAILKQDPTEGDSSRRAGTPLYMAPEQIKGSSLSPRTDIYAVGCIIFEMLTGKPLLLVAGKAGKPDSYSETAVSIISGLPLDGSRRIASIVGTCLMHNPEDRYPDFSSLRLELEDYCRRDLNLEIPALEAGEFPAESLINSCQGLLNLGLRKDAMRVAEQLLETEQEKTIAVHLRVIQARISNEEAEYEHATAFLKEAEKLIDANSDPVFLGAFETEAGRTAMATGRLSDGVRHMEKALELSPSSVTWHNAASAYRSVGRIDDAIKAELKAISISANLAYFFTLAEIFAEVKDYDSARRTLEEAMAAHPQLYRPYVEYIRLGLRQLMDHQFLTNATMQEIFEIINGVHNSAQLASEAGAPSEMIRPIMQAVGEITRLFTQKSE